jgi:hypothetical protein
MLVYIYYNIPKICAGDRWFTQNKHDCVSCSLLLSTGFTKQMEDFLIYKNSKKEFK